MVEGRQGGSCPSPLNFGLLENFRKIVFLSENFCPRMLNLGLNTPISGKCRDKIEILSPHILLSRKFTAVRRKIVTSCPAYFLTHDAADFDLGFKSLKKSPCLTTECSRPSRKIRPLKQSLKTFAGDVSLASRGSCTDRKLFTAWPH